MKNIINLFITATFISAMLSPAQAEEINFRCNSVKNLWSETSSPVKLNGAFIEGSINLVQNKIDPQFPAKASIQLRGYSSDSIILTMLSNSDSDKVKIELESSNDGKVEKIEFPSWEKHRDFVRFAIFTMNDEDIIIQVEDKYIKIANPFSLQYSVRLKCEGSGIFNLRSQTNILTEEIKRYVNRDIKRSRSSDTLFDYKAPVIDAGDMVGAWIIKHDAGFNSKRTKTLEIENRNGGLVAVFDGKYVIINKDGSNFSFIREVQFYIDRKPFGRPKQYKYSGKIENGILSGQYEYIEPPVIKGQISAPDDQDNVLSPVNWTATRL